MQSLVEIRNRRDMSEAFQVAMTGAHQTLRAKHQLGKEQNLPKSYLIEFHPHDNNHSDDWSSEDVYKALSHGGQHHNATIQRTEDDSLIYLVQRDPSHSAEFIVDCLNPRFLIFHTLSNAKATDRFIFNQLTQYQHEFDLFWLPPSLLESVEKREQVIGWEAVFDPLLEGQGFISEEDVEDIEVDSTVEYLDVADETLPPAPKSHASLRMKIKHTNALESYKLLKHQRIFSDVPLDSVWTERQDVELNTFARAVIKSNGKVTGRGSNFGAYMQIVNGAVDNYASVVNEIEERFWLSLDPHGDEDSVGLRLRGEPFCITFNTHFNAEMLVRAMFNCGRPFRLMGTPEQLKDDFFVVDAIDLHVGQPLAFEIAPSLMRIYLYRGTCGNTIMRILRSLQHFIDSHLHHPSFLEA